MSNVAKPCLFLDRDGVIIKNVPYTRDPESVELLHGASQLIQQAHLKNFWVIVVTNQSGIGRGLLSSSDYQAITDRMLKFLKQEGAVLDKIYHAPFYDKSANPEFLQKPHWRKPEPGMIQQACLDFSIDLAKSVMVGDRASDIQLALNSGIGRKILVHSNEFINEQALIPAGIKYELVDSLTEITL